MRVLWGRSLSRIGRKYKKEICRGVLILLSLLILLLFFVNRRLTPEAESLLETELHGAISQRMYGELSPMLDSFILDGVVTLEKNSEGDIRAIMIDSGMANRIKMAMTEQAAAAIRGIKHTKLTIPMGSLYGGALFSGKGGNMTVRSVNVTSVTSEIETKLMEAGINQVMCEAYLNITAAVTARLAQDTVKTAVTVRILLSQFISVGTVPSRYAVVETWDEEMLRWLESQK